MSDLHASAQQPKPENLFGVCAAIGEDFGFNPLYLRVALSAGILWNPLVVLAVYAALAVVVAATRLLWPTRKGQAVVAAEQPAVPAIATANDDVALAKAA